MNTAELKGLFNTIIRAATDNNKVTPAKLATQLDNLADFINEVAGTKIDSAALTAAINTRAAASHTQAASTIIEDAVKQFVSASQVTAWNAKQAAIGYTPESVAKKIADLSGTYNADDYPTAAAVIQHVAANAVVGGGYLPKLSTSGADGEAMVTAMAAAAVVDVDNSPTLPADVTITVPFGKGLNVRAGSVINGPATLEVGEDAPVLEIDGDFAAPPTKVFGQNLKTRFTMRGPRKRKMQNYGGVLMQNFRSNYAVDPLNPDSLEAFTKAIDSSDNINYPGQGKNTVTTLIIDGAYAVSDTIDIFGKTVNFIGESMSQGGSCLKRIGPGLGPIIRFNGSDGSRVENMCFNAPQTANVNDPATFAAIQLMVDGRNFPQRDLHIENIKIGSPIGGENTAGGYYEFENGIIVGTGVAETDFVNSNNDFVKIDKLVCGLVKICFNNNYDQAVDFRIGGAKFVACGLGFKFRRGGSLTIDQVYFDRYMTEGCFVGPDSLSDRLSINVKACSMEHQRTQFFYKADGTTIGTFSDGFISVAFGEQWIQTGLYMLIGGLCMSVSSTFSFKRIKFNASGTGKIFIDCIGTSTNGRSITFEDCDGAEHLWFRFPAGATSSDFTRVKIDGRYVNGYVDHLQDTTLKITKKNRHTTYDAVNNCYWLKLGDVLNDYSINLNYKDIIKGDLGAQPTIHEQIITLLTPATEAENVRTYDGFIPPMCKLKSLVVLCIDGGTPPSGGKLLIGTPSDPDAFGEITSHLNNVINSIPFFPEKYYYATGEDLVITSVDGSGNPTPMPAGKYMTINAYVDLFAQDVDNISYEAAASHPMFIMP